MPRLLTSALSSQDEVRGPGQWGLHSRARSGDSGGSEGSSLVGATRLAEPRSRRWPSHEPGEGRALWSLRETTPGAGADTRAIVPEGEQRGPGASGAAHRRAPLPGRAAKLGARGQRTGLGMEATLLSCVLALLSVLGAG